MDDHNDPFDGDEEAALRYAIALSLQQVEPHNPSSTFQTPILIDSDKEDDEHDDLENGPNYPLTPKKSASGSASATSQTSTSGPHSSSLLALGLDRKKMEEERLARAVKRKSAHSDDENADRPSQRVKVADKPMDKKTFAPAGSRTLPLPFLKGTIKKTVSIIKLIR